jgi:hypothetical protein
MKIDYLFLLFSILKVHHTEKEFYPKIQILNIQAMDTKMKMKKRKNHQKNHHCRHPNLITQCSTHHVLIVIQISPLLIYTLTMINNSKRDLVKSKIWQAIV